MARVKRAVNAHKKRRTTLELASGYRGQRSRLYRKAKEQMLHSLNYAYRDRRARKGDFRQLWITRINAAARANGMTYNRFIQGLKARRASRSTARCSPSSPSPTPAAFAALVEVAKANLPAAPEAQRRNRQPEPRRLEPPHRPDRAHRARRRSPQAAAPRGPRPGGAVSRGGRPGRAGGAAAPRRGARAVRHRRRRPCGTPTAGGPARRRPDRRSPSRRPSAVRHRHPAGHLRRLRPARRAARRALGGAPQLVAVCVGVADPGNAGTVMRVADAAGADAVRAGRATRVDPHNGKAVRASTGSVFHLPARARPRPGPCWRPAAPPASRLLVADAARRARPARPGGRPSCSPGPSPGYSAARRTGCRRRRRSGPTTGSGCRSTGRAESLNLATAAAVCLYASVAARGCQTRDSRSP